MQALPTALQRLIRNNEAPSCDEQVVVEEWIRQYNGGQPDLLQKLEAVVSSTRRIPDEILLEIFFHLPPLGVYDVNDAHWAVSQVCRRWRVAAISCSRLWSWFTIDLAGADSTYGDDSDQDRVPSISPVQLALKRSNGHPIAFTAVCSNASEYWDSSLAQDVLGLLMEHSMQWRSADLGEMSSAFVYLLSCLRNRLPILEELTLGVPIALLDDSRTVRAFESSPITTMRIHNIPFKSLLLPNRAALQRLSLSQATRYFGDPDPSKIYLSDVLELCPVVETLEFAVLGTSAVIDSEAPRVHQNLVSLTTTQTSDFKRIVLPNLTELTIASETQIAELDEIISTQQMTDTECLLRNSHCQLTRLSLNECILPWDVLVKVFRLTPVLEELYVSLDNWHSWAEARRIMAKLGKILAEDEFVSSAADTLQSEMLVPRPVYLRNLRVLKLCAGDEWDFVQPEFMTMLADRRLAGLRELHVGDPKRPYTCGGLKTRIQALKDTKLRVYLHGEEC